MNDNTIEDIREKAEEKDLNSILKPTLVGGGYTKKSVIEYLSYIKKQQQDTKTAYLEEIESLKSEKERLSKEKAELDSDLEEATKKIIADEATIEQNTSEIAALRAKANESGKSARELKVLYDDAFAKNEELNQIIADMSSDPDTQVIMSSCDVELLSEEECAIVEKKAIELTQYITEFKKEVVERANRLAEESVTVGELARVQLCKAREIVEQLQITIQAKNDQYELLENEKNILTMKVEELLEQNLTLSKENTRLKAANAILQRRSAEK